MIANRPTDLHAVAGEIAARAMGSQRPSGRAVTPSAAARTGHVRPQTPSHVSGRSL